MNTQDRIERLVEGLVGNNVRLYHESAYFKHMVTLQARLMLKVGDVLAADGREHVALVEAMEFQIAHGFDVPPELIGQIKAFNDADPEEEQ